jgi:hypothetical protein
MILFFEVRKAPLLGLGYPHSISLDSVWQAGISYQVEETVV